MRGLTFLIFTFLTICCWGIYGPVLHLGQEAMGDGVQLARFKPFMAVGFAYFMIAVIYPAVMLHLKGEVGHWSTGGFVWSFIAGAIGALGALGIILAFNYGGKPVFVMPLVFGCAPVVNTFVTMFMSKTIKEASWIFYVGILVVAIGAAGVLVFSPKPTEKSGHDAQSVTAPSDNSQENVGNDGTGKISQQPVAEKKGMLDKTANWFMMMFSIVLTALCWGAYGPVLHKGQIKMAGSRLRPFLCVGLAYFVIAVLMSIPFLSSDPGSLTFMGSTWSLLAGAAGAFGALGIIYAFNFGGRPIYVMPLVFGLAPVINTMSTTLAKGLWNEIGWPFKISLILVILGAVTVLIMAPRPPVKDKPVKDKPVKPKTKPEEPEKPVDHIPPTHRDDDDFETKKDSQELTSDGVQVDPMDENISGDGDGASSEKDNS